MNTPLSNLPPAEPAERPVEVVVKQEVIEEEQTMEENQTVGLADIPLDDLPPAELAAVPDEAVVKKEWIELCEQRRLPIKKKYQLQFWDVMQLKIEVRKLRRKVH